MEVIQEVDRGQMDRAHAYERHTTRQEGKKKSLVDVETLLLCLHLWCLTMAKALVICAPVLLFLWMLFLPSLILSEDLVDSLKDTLYTKVLNVFLNFFFYAFVATYEISTFGFHFCKRAAFFYLLPGMLTRAFFLVLVDIGIIINLIILVCIVLSHLFIYLERLPQNPSQTLVQQFNRKRDMLKPMAKMFLVLGFIFVFLAMLSTYLNTGIRGQLLLRFFVLPVMMCICNGLQTYYLKAVPVVHLDYAIPMLWISNGFFKIFERLFTNSMFDSGDYAHFALTAFAGSMLEVANHVTYFQRKKLFYKLASFFQRLARPSPRVVRSLSVSPLDLMHQMHSVVALPKAQKPGVDYEWEAAVRKRMVIEDISIEMTMVYTVTLLLYFTHNLVDNERFEMIESFTICLIQLLIQVVFELFADVFGLYWTITQHNLVLKPSDVKLKNRWLWVWIFFMLQQSLWIYSFLKAF